MPKGHKDRDYLNDVASAIRTLEAQGKFAATHAIAKMINARVCKVKEAKDELAASGVCVQTIERPYNNRRGNPTEKPVTTRVRAVRNNQDLAELHEARILREQRRVQKDLKANIEYYE